MALSKDLAARLKLVFKVETLSAILRPVIFVGFNIGRDSSRVL